MSKHSRIPFKKLLADDLRDAGGPLPQHLVITGDGRIGGSSTADQLTGGAGADILIGHGGADVLTGNGADDVLMGERTVVRNPLLAAVTDYAIIYNGLNGANYTQAGLKASDHDLLILYPASQVVSHVETLWTGTQVTDIGTSKLVIAYLDITKINDYEMFVWQSNWTTNGLATGANTVNAPSWLGALDPGDTTSSTRLVNLDDANWVTGLKPFLFARIDALVARGYDGLFLDDLRHFVPANIPATADHARDIRDLVIDLAAHARAQVIANGGTAQQAANFAIIVNGGPYLISDTSADQTPPNTAQNELYYASIDGILAESYFAANETAFINQTITAFGARGIALFAADPNVAAGSIAGIEAAADLAGFIPFAISGNNYGADSPRFVSTMGDNAPGNDQLFGGGGNDGLLGGGGDDYLDGGDGNDSLHGGAGIDGLLGGIGTDFLSGGDGNDSLHGQDGADTLLGGAGNDFLSGGDGADAVYGGTGDDTYIADTSDFIVEAAGEGNDIIYAAASYTLSAGQYIEIVSLGDFAGTAALDLGGNELGNTLWGNAAINVLSGNAGNDSLHGFGGNDGLLGGANDDYLDGGDGEDSLHGGDGNDTLVGAAGNDFLSGGAGIDVVYGGAGNDTVIADAGDYVVEAAGGGTDIVYATASFALSAGQEIETLAAGDSAGAISLTGNALANTLVGNGAANVLTGGGGNDIFAFTTAATAGNADTIADFASGDRIALDDAVFAGIGTPGAFSAAAFVVGSAAADGNDRIVYNSATGQLFYDADGNAPGAAILIATLTGNPVLSASDFQVI